MTPPPTLQELIDTVRQDAGTEDPLGQLSAAASAASDLEQVTDALLGHFVDRCRRAGRSWSEISAALGVTKQAVHKRFAAALAERLTGQPTFERFTQRARSVLAAAAAGAAAAGSRETGTGDLLLGLFAEPDGIAAKVLAGLQVSREQLGTALAAARTGAAPADAPPADAPPADAPPADAAAAPVDASDGPAAAPGPVAGRPPMSPAARSALLNAVTVALELGHNYIGTEHILLGLYRDPDSLAARALAAAGAERSQAERRVAELLRPYTSR